MLFVIKFRKIFQVIHVKSPYHNGVTAVYFPLCLCKCRLRCPAFTESIIKPNYRSKVFIHLFCPAFTERYHPFYVRFIGFKVGKPAKSSHGKEKLIGYLFLGFVHVYVLDTVPHALIIVQMVLYPHYYLLHIFLSSYVLEPLYYLTLCQSQGEGIVL